MAQEDSLVAILNAEIVALRAKIAELEDSENEWKEVYAALEDETEGSLKRQGLVRINKEWHDDKFDIDMVDFWVAPPKNHILNENGDVLEIARREPYRNGDNYMTLTVFTKPIKANREN